MNNKYKKLRVALITYATAVKATYEAPWITQKPLSKKNANKFILGAIIDYQIDADMAWNNAERLCEGILGDPDSLWNHITESYTKNEWSAKWRAFRVHRFPAAHNRIWRIGNEIVRRYEGDARKIWRGKTPSSVLVNLEDMRCGPEISRMVVGVLISCEEIEGKGDVKADRHVCRVLGRVLNRSLSPAEARQVARNIYPDNPWETDVALYDIGKKLCHVDWCYCESCPLGKEEICEDYERYRKRSPESE